MLLGVVLLYVGAVLVVNGIWLIGQARAASAAARVPARAPAENAVRVPAGAAAREAAAGQELGGEIVAPPPPAGAETSPLFIQNREVAVLNIFTGFVGVAAAVPLLVQGNRAGDLASIRASGYILLFAFTYLWVAANQFLNAGGRAFGWCCLSVAITAIPAGIYTLQAAKGNTGVGWLGIGLVARRVLCARVLGLLHVQLPHA